MVLVLAGNATQFRAWCMDRDLNPRDKTVVYARDIQSLRGLPLREAPVEVVTTGSWGDHWSAAETLHCARYIQHKVNTKLEEQSKR